MRRVITMKVFRKLCLAMRRVDIRGCALSFLVAPAAVSGVAPVYTAEQAPGAPSENRVGAEEISRIAQSFEQRQNNKFCGQHLSRKASLSQVPRHQNSSKSHIFHELKKYHNWHGDVLTPFCYHKLQFFQIESEYRLIFGLKRHLEKNYRARNGFNGRR